MIFPNLSRLAVAVAVTLAATGCSTMKPHQVNIEPPVTVNPAFANETPAIQELELEWSADSLFLRKHTSGSTTLPNNPHFTDISFSELGVFDTLRILAADSGLSVRVEGGALFSERNGPLVMENLTGNLDQILNSMADAVGFFWHVQGNTLVIQPDDQFTVNLPPVGSEDTLAGITNSIQYLGARNVYLDRAGRTLTFVANKKGLDKIQAYLEHIRENKSLLIYDTYVFQVDLQNGMSTGIKWNQFGFAPQKDGLGAATAAVGGAAATATGGTGLLDRVGPTVRTFAANSTSTGIGLAYAAPTFTINALLDFLRTQGTVKSLSSPQLVMMSGSKGALRVGNTIQYISKVGSNTTTGISQVTTETTELRTGLAIQLQGDTHDQTIFTRVNLSIAEVSNWVKYTAVGTDLTLPQRQDRDLDISVRSRPGDVVLLGGINIESENQQSQRGVTGFGDSTNRQRSELVLVMKTREVRFTRRKEAPPAIPAALPVQAEQRADAPTT